MQRNRSRAMRTGIVSAALLLLAVAGPVQGVGEKGAFPEPAGHFAPRRYACPFSPAPVRVDGREDDAVWRTVPWSDSFVDITGQPAAPPRLETRVKMAWDGVYFYILARLEEPDIWATLRERDAVIFHDNDFEVFIDPDGDSHRYYELEINALGTAWDLFLDRPYRDGGLPLNHWDMRGMKGAIRVDGTLNRAGDRDRGWWVELALPWAALRECAPGAEKPKPGDIWRVNFSRVEWECEVKNGKYRKVSDAQTGKPLPEQNWVWSPQGLVNMHYPEMWGYVLFTAAREKLEFADFPLPAEEQAKWFLRRVYYRQQSHRAAKGTYADRLDSLGLEKPDIFGFGPISIRTTPSLFEATLPAQDGRSRWSIRQDGLVWKSESSAVR